MRRVHVLLLAILAAGVSPWVAPPRGAGADEPTAEEQEEPELEGEALKAHKREVADILERLEKESNHAIVLRVIEELGAQASRAARDALIGFATGNKNQEFVAKAFESLAKIGGKTAIEFLCSRDALRSKNFLVAQSAASSLAQAKDARATGPLLDVMTGRRTKTEVVGACALALAQSAPADERVIEALFELSNHRKDTIRSYALEALGYLATDEAVARLADALANDKNTRARGSAARGMMNSGRADTIPYLRKAVEEDTALTVKDACLQAIQRLQGGR